MSFAAALAEDSRRGLDLYDTLQANFSEIQNSEDSFQGLVQGAFTPENSDFSGILDLVSKNESSWKLYHNGFAKPPACPACVSPFGVWLDVSHFQWSRAANPWQFDADVRLEGLHYQGELYAVTRDGARQEKA